jgi:DNA repair exonuclease SbcCD nuclease subunit
MTPNEPVNHTKGKMRIAVCGDAGYLGVAQNKVIRMILERHKEDPFDYAIHLGDVYFAGDVDEMALNFLSPFARLTKKGMKLFTLVGNHDLYYGGTSFIFAMEMLQQPGRYFRIDSPHWRIACLDTSLGAINIAGDDAKLDPKQLDWFDSMLAENDDRPLVMMSHHFAISGWSKPAISLTSQLSDRVNDKVFAWYWGHEHNCALYPKSGSNTYWGACVGNGSFIERYAEPARPTTPAWFPKKPCTCYPQKKSYWPHGFIELEFSKGKIEETVHIENRETFKRTLQ